MERPGRPGGLEKKMGYAKHTAYVGVLLDDSCLGGGNSKIFWIFIPKIGEDEPILTNIFQRGWNHN